MFTGSGMPMRFADLDGSIIDCYQVATQMTDESGQSYPNFINQLLDKALVEAGIAQQKETIVLMAGRLSGLGLSSSVTLYTIGGPLPRTT